MVKLCTISYVSLDLPLPDPHQTVCLTTQFQNKAVKGGTSRVKDTIWKQVITIFKFFIIITKNLAPKLC